jgi:hypothetical protein
MLFDLLLQVPVDEGYRLFGIKPFDEDFWPLLVRFLFNFGILVWIVRFYYTRSGDRDYAFTYLVFNPLIFFVCYLMNSVKLEIGFAFGLFAVFSVLRYRTNAIPIKEMTYLFVVITIAIINSLATKKVSYTELLFTNLVSVALVGYLETKWYTRALKSAEVNYEIIENIKPERHEELMADLQRKTGLEIISFDILRTDFLLDTARLRVYYRSPKKK